MSDVASEKSMLDQGLIQAYLETDYCVRGDPVIRLRIGEANAGLLALHEYWGVDSSAFVTACNPHGQLSGSRENDRRQLSLAQELNSGGFPYLEAIGIHPEGGWPGEPSYLILGSGLQSARSFGIRYRQNAILWAGSDGIPQLILLR